MLIKQYKSGQATIVLIVVTMVTVLGVAVAASSQSRINLRDTVYSTQSVQALSCAESGADRALVDSRIASDTALGAQLGLDSTGSYAVKGCDGYTATIDNYPVSSPGEVFIPNVPEGNTQEFTISSFTVGTPKTVNFKSNIDNTNPTIAVYVYYGSAASPQVSRSMVFCNAGGANGTTPENFTAVTAGNVTMGGVAETNVCSYSVTIPASPIIMRVRPLYADIKFQVPSFQGATGYKIVSVGKSGQVQRNIDVIRFYGQLSGAFDESIVAGDSIIDN